MDDARPLLIYDGDCGFCRAWIERWRVLTGERVAYAASKEVGDRYPQIRPDSFHRSVQLVLPTGEVFAGAEAVLRALAEAPGHGWELAVYQRLPGARRVCEFGYEQVARRRDLFSRLTRFFWGDSVLPSTYAHARWLFLRALALVYGIAFLSAFVQIRGLLGSDGILPAGPWLQAVRERFGAEAFHLVPTIFWIHSGDTALRLVPLAGAAGALLLLLDLAPGLLALLLWAGYLSLVSVGRDFFSFQWDMLLLESGFIAIFLAPWRWGPRRGREMPASGAWIWLLRWLLFRLMFGSGLVKLLSGDATWRNLTALRYHYWTQPIPNPVAWYARLLPFPVPEVSCALVLVLELAVPFLIFTPRRTRRFGCLLLVALQILIAMTGNFAFFNILSLALCLPLLDDAFLSRFLPTRLQGSTHPAGVPARGPRSRTAIPVAAGLLFLLSLTFWGARFFGWERVPAPARSVAAWLQPFGITGNYGLFAVMTTTRPEIVVEGSRDGRDWRAYEFRFKPGDERRGLPFVAPHQPRLDWQMWFAALSGIRDTPWFAPFLERILQGSPEVLGLLRTNPFPGAPPRYVRAQLYQYRFATPAERRAQGVWWERSESGEYAPALELDQGRLVEARIAP